MSAPFREPPEIAVRFLECGGWRGTGLTPLWNSWRALKPKRCVPSPSPTALQDAGARCGSWSQCAPDLGVEAAHEPPHPSLSPSGGSGGEGGRRLGEEPIPGSRSAMCAQSGTIVVRHETCLSRLCQKQAKMCQTDETTDYRTRESGPSSYFKPSLPGRVCVTSQRAKKP